MKKAVIILGHGSRAEGAGEALVTLAAMMRGAEGRRRVEHAFLQYAPPALDDAVRRCTDQGASEIVIVPFFVQTGAHVTKDIPARVEELRKRYPAVRFRVTDHVGGHPLMARIVEELVTEQVQPRMNADAREKM